VIARARPATPALDRTILGMFLFIASEAILFLSVVVAYLATREPGLADARATLDLGRTAIFSVALFSSSATVALAGARRDVRWLAATMLLGAVFLAGQGSEYARLLTIGIGPSSALFGTTFFTLTGLHGAHVLVGLIALGALAGSTIRRGVAVGPIAWEAVSLYWHFVDAVWIVVFSVAYLGTFL